MPNGTSQIDDYQYNLIGGGVVIQGGADNLIGTSGLSANDLGERNVISGNAYDGVDVAGASAIGNVIAGNFIGVDATGAFPWEMRATACWSPTAPHPPSSESTRPAAGWSMTKAM